MISGKRKNLLFKMIDEYVDDSYIRAVIKQKMLEILDYSGYKERVEKQKEQRRMKNELFSVFENIKIVDIDDDKEWDDSNDATLQAPQFVREMQLLGDPHI